MSFLLNLIECIKAKVWNPENIAILYKARIFFDDSSTNTYVINILTTKLLSKHNDTKNKPQDI